jgi:Na+/phosphate symporter
VGVVLGVHSESLLISFHASQKVLKFATFVVDAFGVMFATSLITIFFGWFRPAVHPIHTPLPMRTHPSTTIAIMLSIFFFSSLVIAFILAEFQDKRKSPPRAHVHTNY